MRSSQLVTFTLRFPFVVVVAADKYTAPALEVAKKS